MAKRDWSKYVIPAGLLAIGGYIAYKFGEKFFGKGGSEKTAEDLDKINKRILEIQTLLLDPSITPEERARLLNELALLQDQREMILRTYKEQKIIETTTGAIGSQAFPLALGAGTGYVLYRYGKSIKSQPAPRDPSDKPPNGKGKPPTPPKDYFPTPSGASASTIFKPSGVQQATKTITATDIPTSLSVQTRPKVQTAPQLAIETMKRQTGLTSGELMKIDVASFIGIGTWSPLQVSQMTGIPLGKVQQYMLAKSIGAGGGALALGSGLGALGVAGAGVGIPIGTKLPPQIAVMFM